MKTEKKKKKKTKQNKTVKTMENWVEYLVLSRNLVEHYSKAAIRK